MSRAGELAQYIKELAAQAETGNLHGRRREPTASDCPLTFKHALWQKSVNVVAISLKLLKGLNEYRNFLPFSYQ